MSKNLTDLPGTIVQNYQILKKLGSGNYSTVFYAKRLADSKLVALKIINVLK